MSTPVIHRIDREPVQFPCWVFNPRVKKWARISRRGALHATDTHWCHSDKRPTIDPTAEGCPMTFEQFKKHWDAAGFTFEATPKLAAALLAEANGDHSVFDEIEKRLASLPAEPSQPASPVPSGEPTAEEMLEWMEKNASHVEFHYSLNGITRKNFSTGVVTKAVIRAAMAAMRGSKEAK